MASWSAENATKAYLHALKMGKRDKELDVAELISALAAGNNAQLMVIASASKIDRSTTLSLVAAAHQTGGNVVYILPTKSNLCASQNALGPYADCVKFVIGDAKTLLPKDYRGADFVLVDCDIDECKEVLRAAQECSKHGKGLIVGYNAFHKGSSWSCEFKTRFLHIGEGLLVTRIGPTGKGTGGCSHGKRSTWVTEVDKCTGEEHVYRITSALPQRKRLKFEPYFGPLSKNI
ncbi:unnamed protein product [Dovyalis caffra]|uniref:Uncharacterized protein n=1 Tax=Dovyalis caffra TaxID=77055 RepID=A0AAV1S9F6_9ROSI|nr:unnamed protein product [Dovyalis caffra]